MTNRDPLSPDAALVAIDVAKVRNEVLIEAAYHKRRRRLSVLNTRAEPRSLDRGSARLWQAGDLRLRGNRQLPSFHRLASDRGGLRGSAGIFNGSRPDAGSVAQWLG